MYLSGVRDFLARHNDSEINAVRLADSPDLNWEIFCYFIDILFLDSFVGPDYNVLNRRAFTSITSIRGSTGCEGELNSLIMQLRTYIKLL